MFPLTSRARCISNLYNSLNTRRLECPDRSKKPNNSQRQKLRGVVWYHAHVCRRPKTMILDTCICLKLLYGLESCMLLAADRGNLNGFQARCQCKIYRISTAFMSRVSNEEVRKTNGTVRSDRVPHLFIPIVRGPFRSAWVQRGLWVHGTAGPDWCVGPRGGGRGVYYKEGPFSAVGDAAAPGALVRLCVDRHPRGVWVHIVGGGPPRRCVGPIARSPFRSAWVQRGLWVHGTAGPDWCVGPRGGRTGVYYIEGQFSAVGDAAAPGAPVRLCANRHPSQSYKSTPTPKPAFLWWSKSQSQNQISSPMHFPGTCLNASRMSPRM